MSGAIIFKIFNRMLFNWILEKGYFDKVKFCVPVHDEMPLDLVFVKKITLKMGNF